MLKKSYIDSPFLQEHVVVGIIMTMNINYLTGTLLASLKIIEKSHESPG